MPSAIANKSSARMTKRYSVLRCRAISSTIFRDLADRSIFGEVLLGTWTLTMIDVDCFKCRFYHSKSEVENFRKAPLGRENLTNLTNRKMRLSGRICQVLFVRLLEPKAEFWRFFRYTYATTRGLTTFVRFVRFPQT